MPNPRFAVIAIQLTALTLVAYPACSQPNYPARPVRIITPLPGGAGDFTARLIAQGIAASLGQPVIVDNRPSNMTGETAMKAAPDGHTLLLDGNSLWFTSLMQATPYDVLRDFSPITLVLSSPTILVVHPSVAAHSVSELVALAKSKPGALNYGSAGYASAPHFAMELFKAMTGVNVVHVPFKGAGPAVTDLVGGHIQLMIGTAPSVTPNIKAGRLRALAVTSAQPSLLAPGLPTLAASGLPGYEFASINGVFAPAKTPAAIIERLNQEIIRAVTQPEVKEKLLNIGTEVVTSSPDGFATKLKSEVAKWGKLIKDVGIRAE
jgi:tripartite-type tricarboxylate transporter receptor subunit TctC